MFRLTFLLFLLAVCPALFAAPEASPQGPLVSTSATRSEIVLNGAWLFQPATAEQKQPGSDWGTIQVPGSWFPERSGTVPGILQRGTGEDWKKIGDATSAAWYERTIQIPADWAGKEIVVDFDRISTDALVFLDGKEAGKIEWPGGNLNITALARPGTPQTLMLYVTASTDAMVLDYMGIGQNTVQKANLDTRGIIGDVVLSSFPRGASLGGIFIQPSVRDKKLTVQVDWNGQPPTAAVACEVVAREWPGGAEAKRWSVELPPGAKSFSLDWTDPKLWDYKQPNLYTLSVAAKGPGIDDEVAERFGFREWRVDGRTLLLNEIPFRPQPANLSSGWMTPPGFGNPRAIGALLDLHLSRGIGLGWEWPGNFFQRGKPFYQGALARAADEKGFPIFGNLYRLNEFVNDKDFKNIWPQNKDRWEDLTVREWKKYRNHPSIVGWILSGNLGPKHADQDPRKIGQTDWDPNEVNALQTGVKEFMHGLDPGRSAFFGAAAWAGDIYSAMTYLNFIPLQEREEWLSEWASSGTMPYIAIEFGTPLQNSYMRGRNHFGPSGQTEPWLAEFAAIYLGPDAYKESQKYRRKIRSNYEKGNKFQSFNFDSAMVGDPVYQSIQELFIRNTWRSWRSMNAGWAGMLSWADDYNLPSARNEEEVNLLAEFQPGMRGAFPPSVKARALGTSYRDDKAFTIRPGGEQLLAQGQPVIAWIAGPAEAFTAKDHNLRSGQLLKKQAAIVNDTRGPLPYEGKWTLSVGGKEAAAGEVKGTIEAGTSELIPFEGLLPTVDAGMGVAEGEVKLSVKVGEETREDSFAFLVFPTEPKSPPVKNPVLVADPVGKTSTWLTSLGVTTKPWDGKPVPNALLVVGRQALSGYPEKAPKLSALEAFVAAGGRLLIMSQDAEWIRQNLGFRVTRQSTRRMWPVRGDHPLMAGVPVASLRDWSGTSTLQEAKPEFPTTDFPPYGWRWGQRGVLGASVIEKPHFTGWRPLFESEFDLQYAPLMELDYGKGRVTWCSLDLEDQADPAAEKLGRNILQYVATAPLVPRVAKTVYIGGEAGDKFLKSIGLVFERKPSLDPSAQLTVLAPDADVSPQALWSYVDRGGRVFFLGHSQGGVDYFGAKTALEKNFRGSTNPPAEPEFAGLSASDLRLKTDVDWRTLSPEGMQGFQRLADGMLGLRKQGPGEAVWAQLGPDLLQGDKKELPEYLRFNRWRQCRAISQILANLGATFQADTRVFRPQIERISLAGPWAVKVTSELPVKEGKHLDPGISESAKALVAAGASAGQDGWDSFELPAWYPAFDKVCGEGVWKREVFIPAEWAGKFVQINIPGIKSYDTVFWNGQPVGSTSIKTQKEDPWNLPRKYRVTGSLVKAGKNTITIRHFVPDRQGGIHGRAGDFFLRVLSGEKEAAPLYYPDYREEFDTGDEPYRYIRW